MARTESHFNGGVSADLAISSKSLVPSIVPRLHPRTQTKCLVPRLHPRTQTKCIVPRLHPRTQTKCIVPRLYPRTQTKPRSQALPSYSDQASFPGFALVLRPSATKYFGLSMRVKPGNEATLFPAMIYHLRCSYTHASDNRNSYIARA